MRPKFHALKIKEVQSETEDTVSISFEIPSELKSDYKYIAGQYFTLRTDINGEDIRRSYSLCSSPTENEWRVAIKRVENGKFSTFATSSLSSGDVLEVMTPAGNFTFTPDSARVNSYALFAAGSGITPIISIVKSILENEPDSNVTLFYGNKQIQSVIFKEEIEGLKNEYMSSFRVVHILSRENIGAPILNGRIDLQKTNQLFDSFLAESIPDHVYICGPEEMIHSVKDSMHTKGVKLENIHFELFTTSAVETKKPVEADNAPKVESNVSVIIDGDTFKLHLESNGENILDAASKTGADLPFACKGGVCCTCKAKILEGSASMDVNYALEADEVEAGYILTCQAHPTSDKLVVSFDD